VSFEEVATNKIIPTQPRSPLQEWTKDLLDEIDQGPPDVPALIASEFVPEFVQEFDENTVFFRARSIAGNEVGIPGKQLLEHALGFVRLLYQRHELVVLDEVDPTGHAGKCTHEHRARRVTAPATACPAPSAQSALCDGAPN
jgi:hypothetical protein